uniref:Uncharacterized protein n=1 Tax=Arundo donax TaxID=35708 RepID=A0A0A9E6E4_ARUDO
MSVICSNNSGVVGSVQLDNQGYL